MSEEEGYAEDGKEDSKSAEYIVPVTYYLHFFDRVEPPSESEIKEELNSRALGSSLFAELRDIGKAELA